MYKETLKAKDLVTKSKLSQQQIDSKVNSICDAFLAVLEQPQYKEDHLQNIITSHVCKVPPALEAGLDMIGRLQCTYLELHHLYSSPDPLLAVHDPLTEKAAEHICFLADVNQLYDTSLGLYNLDLALLIAQQSQKVRNPGPVCLGSTNLARRIPVNIFLICNLYRIYHHFVVSSKLMTNLADSQKLSYTSKTCRLLMKSKTMFKSTLCTQRH